MMSSTSRFTKSLQMKSSHRSKLQCNFNNLILIIIITLLQLKKDGKIKTSYKIYGNVPTKI